MTQPDILQSASRFALRIYFDVTPSTHRRRRGRLASILSEGENMKATGISDAALRVRREYLEMPGLSLTIPQARRLWQIDEHTCQAVLDALVELEFLKRTRTGAYVRNENAA
jgi:hypothetical protein